MGKPNDILHKKIDSVCIKVNVIGGSGGVTMNDPLQSHKPIVILVSL